MSVQHLLLGALMEKPDYGYNLKKGFFSRLLTDFGINEGQLYPALKKLEEKNAVRKEVIVQEGSPNRHRYFITEKGRAIFLEWLRSSDGEDRAFRYEILRSDTFFNRSMYLKYLDRETALEKIKRQISLTENTISDFTSVRKTMTARDVDPIKVKILEYGLMSQEARLAWLREFMELMIKYPDGGANNE